MSEPEKVWLSPENTDKTAEWKRGASEAWHGLGVNYRSTGKTEDYKAGRKAQCSKLPRKEGKRRQVIDWRLYSQGVWYDRPKSGLEHWAC